MQPEIWDFSFGWVLKYNDEYFTVPYASGNITDNCLLSAISLDSQCPEILKHRNIAMPLTINEFQEQYCSKCAYRETISGIA